MKHGVILKIIDRAAIIHDSIQSLPDVIKGTVIAPSKRKASTAFIHQTIIIDHLVKVLHCMKIKSSTTLFL